MIQEYEANKALKTLPDYNKYPGWSWKNPRKATTPCKKCGSAKNVWCLYADAGGVDYYDEYYHVCLECGHTEHKSDFYQTLGNLPDVKCPFCNKKR